MNSLTTLDEYIEKIIKELPELCSPSDLVRVGLYTDEQAAYRGRVRGDGPPFFKMHYIVVYPKKGVIEYFKIHKGYHDRNHSARSPRAKSKSASSQETRQDLDNRSSGKAEKLVDLFPSLQD